MSIHSRQIGWSTESNLLWQIWKQLEKLTGVVKNTQSVRNGYYGNFYDTTTQTVVSGGVAAIKYNTTDFANGVSVENDAFAHPTLIAMSNTGVYDIQFSAQLRRNSGGDLKKVNIWLRKNGTDVPNSNTHLEMISNSGYVVAAWNFFVQSSPGDKFQLMWSQNDLIDMIYEPANLVIPHPATPSVILTVNQVS